LNKALLNEGLYINPVVPPAASEAMLRLSLMASHTSTDIADVLEILSRVGRQLGQTKEIKTSLNYGPLDYQLISKLFILTSSQKICFCPLS
jgi:hypothetical protein